MEITEEKIKKIIGLRLYFEAPSDWTTREYIEIIDEYLMERLPVMINNSLEPYGLEASIMEGIDECSLGISPCSKDTIVAEIYPAGSSKPLFRVIFYRKIGENTYEFTIKRVLKA